MAWCYYCRRYTVNGRCPVCNRLYEEPGKSYDFYGKEIKKSPPPSSKGSKDTYDSDPLFSRGVWLGIAINFGAIIIAKKTGRVRVGGAVLGTVLNSLFLLHVFGILLVLVAQQTGFDFWGLMS